MRRFLRMGAAVATLCCGGGAMGQTDPKPIDPATWVTQDDYPAEALNANESGTVVMRMAIDAKGAVTGCTIVQSSGSASLDTTSCNVMRERARFTPATDANGQPTTSTFQRRIQWSSPNDVASPLSPFAMVIRLTLGEKGAVLACETTGSGMNGESFHACQQKDGQYTGFANMGLSGFRPGILTLSNVFEVDGVPFRPAPARGATSDIPPYFTQIERLTVDATGKVSRCERRSSRRDTIEPCSYPVGYEPKPGQPARHATMTTSMAFQPKQ